MGDRIAVMSDGMLQQLDTPQNLYDQPANMFVAGFIGSPSMNFIDVTLEGSGGRSLPTPPASALRRPRASRTLSRITSGKPSPWASGPSTWWR